MRFRKRKTKPQRLKPIVVDDYSARLKPCPDKAPEKKEAKAPIEIGGTCGPISIGSLGLAWRDDAGDAAGLSRSRNFF
jgi:hypothetical protein